MGSFLIRMKEGLGETSYAKNCSVPKKAIDQVKNKIIGSAVETYLATNPKCMAIADLGCSSGPNALSLVSDIVEAITRRCREDSRAQPEFQVFLNDLPTNDFNTLFVSFPKFSGELRNAIGCDPPAVFLNGVPGSFHGRLFPSNSMHLIYSCSSVHWLSKVPSGLFDDSGYTLNKGKIILSETSPPAVGKAYLNQFQKDFNNLLKSRSVELVLNGRLALLTLGRHQHGHERSTDLVWDVFAQTLANMASQKVVEEEKVDSFNLQIYLPSLMELEYEVQREGTFTIERAEVNEVVTDTGDHKKDAWSTSMTFRSALEPMIHQHFGGEVVNEVFQNYFESLTEVLEKKEVIKWVFWVVILRKLK